MSAAHAVVALALLPLLVAGCSRPGEGHEAFVRGCRGPWLAVARGALDRCPETAGPDVVLERARAQLVAAGLARDAEFAGLQLQWCAEVTVSLAPDGARILLNPSLAADPAQLAAALARELEHVRGWRAGGAGAFECAYSRELMAGRGTGPANRVEQPAHAAASRARVALGAGPLSSGPASPYCEASGTDPALALQCAGGRWHGPIPP